MARVRDFVGLLVRFAAAMPIAPTEKEMLSHRRYKRSSGDSRSVRPPARSESSHLNAPLVMRISSTETEIPGHGRLKRSSSSKDARADADADASHHEAARAMPISSTEIEVSGQGRLKRPSSSESGSASYPTWVILNRVGVRRDSFDGDGTTSAVSYTSGGEQISVSFVLEKPPRTSLITLDWPQGPSPSEGSTSKPRVVAAHRNVVLLEISRANYLRPASIDFFVYKASGSGGPSLTRLPVCYWKGPWNADSPRPRIMGKYSTGLLSCSDDFFVVADLARGSPQPSLVDIYLMCSGSNDWKVFRDVPIHNADSVPHLSWWSTDVVLPWRHHYLIWVDYFRGMIFARITHPGNGIDLQEPVLRYVPLPVDPVQGNTYDNDYGRGCPAASRSICNTHHGIKFVSINQRGSSFSISLWSLCQEKWREDATLDADQLWDLDFENRLTKVQPAFPVVDMENPDAVCFLLNEGRYTVIPDTPTWMIKIHMTKKILLDSHYYSKGSPSYQKTYTTARRMSEGLTFISSGMPSYLSGQTMER